MTPTKILASVILTFGCMAVALNAAPAEKKKTGAATTAAKQKQFDDPKQAADSLVQAAESFDSAALLGDSRAGQRRYRQFGRPSRDKQSAVAFAAKAKEKIAIVPAEKNPNLAFVTVGNDAFELPDPAGQEQG